MTANSPTRVLIVDDHSIVREGLRSMLESHPDFEVVGEAADGAQALALYRSLRPDMAIIDLRIPSTGGIDLIRAITAFDAHSRLLVLTAVEGDADVRAALAAGASGFLLKGARGDDIAHAVRQVSAGKQWLARDVREILKRSASTRNLSKREIEVLTLIINGLPNQEIADTLKLTLHTVKAHVQSVLLKLNASDRTEAAVTALRRGLVHL